MNLYVQGTPVYKARRKTKESIVSTLLLQNPSSAVNTSIKPMRVLVTAEISDGVLANTQEGDYWLQSYLPSNIEDIQGEGMSDRVSSVVLLNYPIAAWNIVADDYAWSFLNYVESENLVVQDLEQQ